MKDNMLGILTTKNRLKTDAGTTTNVMAKEHAALPDGAKEPPDLQKMKIIIIMRQ
jgi:hypothetical protein